MEDIEAKIAGIIENPDMMQKIMALAQSMGGGTPAPPEAPPKAPEVSFPDMQMIQKLTSFAGKSTIDPNQRNLLNALTPYLSSQRVAKLERAMRAAKMASMASGLFGFLQSEPGR